MMPTLDTIAVAVRAELDRRGMSVSELARASGVGRVDLVRWLNGTRSIRVVYAADVLAALGLVVRRGRVKRSGNPPCSKAARSAT